MLNVLNQIHSVNIPEKLGRVKQARVIIGQASLDTINDDMVSTRDYSDYYVGDDKISGYVEINESYAAELLSLSAGELQPVKIKKRINGQVIEKEILAYVMEGFFIVNLNDNENDPDKKAMLLEKKREIATKGFFYIDCTGKKRRVRYMMASPAQERTVKYFGVAEHVAHPIEALAKLGHTPLAYAKKTGETDSKGNPIYKIDYVKAMKRFGLTLSNSVKSNFIQIGKEAYLDEATGDVIITGGNVTVRIVEDVYSIVRTGLFKAFRKDRAYDKNGQPLSRAAIFDASENPVEIVAGDGQFYFNERVKRMAEAEFGRSFQNGVTRMFNGYAKGNGVYIPNLDRYFKEDIIIPMSVFKGSADVFEEVLEDMDIQFRVALFGERLRYKKRYVKLPYQFAHGIGLTP